MNKKQGALSGFLGGVVFAIFLRFNETAVFQIRIVLNRLWNFPFPLYETLHHSPEAELIVKFAFILVLVPFITLVWTGVGILFATLSAKQNWRRKVTVLAWIVWGLLPAFLFLLLRTDLFQCTAEARICQSALIAGATWALFASLMGSLVSVLYVMRQTSIRGNFGIQG